MFVEYLLGNIPTQKKETADKKVSEQRHALRITLTRNNEKLVLVAARDAIVHSEIAFANVGGLKSTASFWLAIHQIVSWLNPKLTEDQHKRSMADFKHLLKIESKFRLMACLEQAGKHLDGKDIGLTILDEEESNEPTFMLGNMVLGKGSKHSLAGFIVARTAGIAGGDLPDLVEPAVAAGYETLIEYGHMSRTRFVADFEIPCE